MTSLPSTISNCQQQIGELTEKLTPVTPDAVARGIRSLLAAGLALPSGMQEDKAPEIYNFALEGVPRYGVQKAIANVIKGVYEINKSFVPTPPELAAIARLESRPIRDDLVRLREVKETLEPPKPDSVSEEGRAKVRALLKDFRQKNAERRAREAVPEMPFNGGQKEYYAKILAMKDAPSLTEEQAEFRSKIASKLEG